MGKYDEQIYSYQPNYSYNNLLVPITFYEQLDEVDGLKLRPLYTVDSFGRIYSNSKVNQGKQMSSMRDKDGYYRMGLFLEDGRRRIFPVHRVVAAAFIDDGTIDTTEYQINHIDGIKDNNYYGNLEYCTDKENVQHAMKTGLDTRRDLSNETVHEICKMLQDGKRIINITDYFISLGYKKSIYESISNIKSGTTYTDISSRYNFPDTDHVTISSKRILNDEIVHEICRKIDIGDGGRDIAHWMESIGIIADCYTMVRSIKCGVSYRNISTQYNFLKNK